MSTARTLASLLVAVPLLLVGCTHKPVEQTTTHTNVTTKSDTGEVKSTDMTTTTTDKADGTQTVKTTTTSEQTTPPPPPAPAPMK